MACTAFLEREGEMVTVRSGVYYRVSFVTPIIFDILQGPYQKVLLTLPKKNKTIPVTMQALKNN